MQVAVDKLLLSATVKLDYFFVHNISCYIDPYCVIVVVTRRNDTWCQKLRNSSSF
jgi:hypothetical protein